MKRGLVVLGVVFGLVALFLVGGSYMAASQVEGDTAAMIADVEGEADPGSKLKRFDTLKKRVELLSSWVKSGAPPRLWLLFDHVEVHRNARERYRAAVVAYTATPLVTALEERLEKVTGAEYLDAYNTLKLYMLITDGPKPGYEDWLVQNIAAERSAQLASDFKTRRALSFKIIEHLLEVVGDWPKPKQESRAPLVQRVRDILNRVASTHRYYDQIVTVLEHLKLDEAGPDTPENKRHLAVTLETILGHDLPINSDERVRGPYTKSGALAVTDGLASAIRRSKEIAWVLAPDSDRIDIPRIMARVRADYDAQFSREWRDLLESISFGEDRKALLKFLATPEYPYAKLLNALKTHSEAAAPTVKKEFASLVTFDVKAWVEAIAPLSATLDGGGTPDWKAAETKTRALLLKLDAKGQALMAPLVLRPLGVEP